MAMHLVKIAWASGVIATIAPLLAEETNEPPTPASSADHVISPAERARLIQKLHAMSMLIEYRQGKILLTADEIKQYMTILNTSQSGRAKENQLPADNLGSHAPRMVVANLPLETFAQAYGVMVGQSVVVADRAKNALISMTVAAPTDAEIVRLIETQLRAQGIAVIRNTQSVTLDLIQAPP